MAEAGVDQALFVPSMVVVAPRDAAIRHLSPLVISGSLRAVDAVIILLSSLIAYQASIWLGRPVVALDRCVLTAALLTALFLWTQNRMAAYAVDSLHRTDAALSKVALGWFCTVSVGMTLVFLTHGDESYPRGWVILATSGAFVNLAVLRGLAIGLIRRWRRRGLLARGVIVFGSGAVRQALLAALDRDPVFRVLGVFDDDPARDPMSLDGRPVGRMEDLVAFARLHGATEVVAAVDLAETLRIAALVELLRPLPINLRLSLSQLRLAGTGPLGCGAVGCVPTVDLLTRPLQHWSAVAKRIEDLAVGFVLFAVAAPIMAGLALLVRLTSPGPVLFVQERFGLNNRIIRVLKFRTMYCDQGDQSGGSRTTRGDTRVTPLGRWLRAFSLDELPQFFNVLRGDMSLVGPRPHPLTMKAGGALYQDAVGAYFARHRVRPGITGWAQVNGCRGEIDSLDKARRRVDLDLEYIENWSLWLDLKILARSVFAVFSRENAY